MNETAKSRFSLLLSICGALSLAGCSGGAAEDPPLAGARLGGAFTLTDHRGRQVTERDFAGRYRIAYFGFSHCPDICPTDLAAIAQGLRAFEKEDAQRAARVVPTFVSVDPERDTPQVLAEYVAAFHPRLVGLTGTPQQVAAAAKGHGIYYAKGEVTAGGGYNVNHGSQVTLFGPEGQPLAFLPTDKGGAAVAAELRRWVK
jgi:protein SCO1/2